MTATRTPVTISGNNYWHPQANPNRLYRVEAIAADGRRWWYGYPDGGMRDGCYLRDLTEDEFDNLCRKVRLAGGINADAPCWYQGEPVYGSAEYERQGCEEMWRQREVSEAAWYYAGGER
jgi:hypothetical protein